MTLHYRGSLRLTISTNLTISLGSRFKSYTVSLLLAVVIRSLEGNLLLHIKPPPSNRLWFGFTQMPKMDIGIEPVVSERKVAWSMVTKIIESRIREMVSELNSMINPVVLTLLRPSRADDGLAGRAEYGRHFLL